MRGHVVNGEEFFDGGNHPEIVFRSTRVELAEDGGVAVDGELDIKGIVRPVTATGTYRPPVEDPYGASRGAIELGTVVDRRDWDMNWQIPLPAGGEALGYEVELSAHLELIKQG
jgi:polyisoprenoid-binding protein YceI